MADPKIKIRRSATPNKVPSKDQLQLGELAINTYDGKLYLEQDQGGVGVGNTVIAVNPWGVGIGSTAYNTQFTAGKVGVGTTNAQYNLDVGGDINFTGNLYQDGSAFTSGVGIKTAGGVVGYGATIIDFRGPGVTTAYYSSATGIGTVYFQGGGGSGGGGGASVTVSDSAPGSPSNGDLWFKSDVGELYVYYTDGSSNQWVEASGGSNTVVTSDTAPTSPQDGDLWWNSNTGELKIYYNDGNSSQWVDANSEGGFLQYWTQTNTNGTLGVTTTSYVGIGTTTATDALTVRGNANVTGFLTATQLNGAVSSTGVNVSGVATALNLIAPVTSSGVNVTGVATALHLKGPLTSSGINVTGVSTFSNTVDINSNLDVSGNATIGGVLTYEDVRNVDSIGIVTARTGIKVLAGGANIVDGTTTDELNVTGVATAVQLNATTTNVSGVSTFAGNIDANGDLDVDGITNLDDVSITGVSTFAGNIDANGDLDVDGHTELDNVNVIGIATIQQVKATTLNVTGVSTVTGGVKVGTAATICSEGNMTIDRPSAGIITATKFIGDGSDLTGVISGIGIGTAGGVVGYAATIVHFKGAGVTTAYYNATTGIGTIFFHSATTGGGGGANVTVSDTPPGSPSAGDLWWESDIGELKIYYSDGDSAQWVDASGADSLVQIGTSAPTGAVSGDLWFNSESGDFMVYYTDANSSAWISVNAVNSNTKWITNATGIHTTGNVGIGTTTATDPLTVVGATDLDGTLLVSGITTFGSHVYHGDSDHAIFGDGSDLSLYHDSSNSWIKNTTGNLTLNSNIIHLKDGGNNKNYLRTYTNDRVEIYFNNGEKFRTTNTGVSVTGDIVGSGSTAYSTGLIVGKQGAEFQGVVTATTFVGALTGNASGNAATATALQNARTIGGVSFDGTANINLPGVNAAGNQNTTGTSAGLTGTPAITVGALTANTGQFSGNVNILGTLTYEDVKNVDSAGIATARQGLRITGGGLDVVGISTFNNHIKLPDSDKAIFGTGEDLQIQHTGASSQINETTGELYINTNKLHARDWTSGNHYLQAAVGAGVTAFFNGSKKIETTSTGIDVTGAITADDLRTDNSQTFYLTTANDFRFRHTGGTERLRIDSSGNIWHNYNSSAQDARLRFVKQETGSCGPEFYLGNGTQKAYIHLDSEENMVYLGQSGVHHRFYTGGSTESFRVASNGTAFFAGNVGMGNYATPTAKLSLGSGTDPIKMLLYDNSASANEKYGFGIQASELRQFFPSNSARFSLGTISSSDGSTFDEKIRLESSGIVMLSQGATQTNALQSYTAEGAYAYHYVARTTSGSDRYRRMFDIVSVGDSTHGSSIRFMTSKDGAAAAIERMRIMHDGGVLVQDDASLTHNANHPHRECPGLLTVHNGGGASNRTDTSTGVYAPPTGGFVNYADYELAAKLITISNSNCNIIMAKNGEPLYINDARNNWGFYNKLPNYLLGLPCTDCINNSNFTLTLAADMLVFMLRESTWNSIGSGSNGYPNGWTLIETGTNIGPAGSNSRLYVKSTTMNSYSGWDNDSAMYFFRLA